MKKIWEAFIARLVYWFTPRIDIPEDLGDDVCQCSHFRCQHDSGRYKCNGWFYKEGQPDDEWHPCGCVFFVESDDDDEPEPEAPSPEELEELFKK